MSYVTIKIGKTPPIASVEENGESAQKIFSERWPVVHRLLQLEVEARANINAENDGDEFPNTDAMTGAAELQSIEYGANFRGEPIATYLVRCAARGGGFHLTVEVVMGARGGENIYISDTEVR